MSKRHQSSRRRAYGRRQHELRERIERIPPGDESGATAPTGEAGSDGLTFMDLELSGRRLTFAVGD
jgi:hypothetical protein